MAEEEIYNSGQARELLHRRLWPLRAQWFVVGGPADGNEAQTVHQRYPAVQCIGFEPNPKMLDRQLQLDFPGTVYPFALWNRDEIELQLSVPDHRNRCSSVTRDFTDTQVTAAYTVQARTLDSLSKEFGPFTNCVLWLDIEFAESYALQGAVGLLESRNILLLNVELFDASHRVAITEFLAPYGLVPVHEWNRSMPGKCDMVYALKENK